MIKNPELLTLLFVLLASLCCPALSNTKMLYSENWGGIRVKSENDKFIAVFMLPSDMNDRMLEVFDVNDEQRNPIWKISPFQKYIPHDMFVSDDGKYVVIIDDSRKPAGNALEFYSEDKGRIKAYSRHDILSFIKKEISQYNKEFFSASYSLFHKARRTTYFCSLAWKDREFYWLVWNTATGEYVKPNQGLTEEICKQTREQLSKQILKPWNYKNKIVACFFLLKLKRPGDRALIEKLLDEEHFVTNPKLIYKESLWTKIFEFFNIDRFDQSELDYFYTKSGLRELADTALACWDGKINEAQFSWRSGYYPYYSHYYLGTVSVKVTLPAKPKRRECLWVYLVPESVDRSKWDNKRPAHYLYADFDGLSTKYKIGRTVSCVFMVVKPGNYWLKAFWDGKKPYYNEDDKFYKPQNGDYENIDSPIFQVKAAQTTDVGTIECNHKVKTK